MKIAKLERILSESKLFVKITTDDGLFGLGESTLNTRSLPVDAVLADLEPVLVGQDPFRIEHIWQDVFRGTFWRGGPVLLSALSGVDIALWDLKGKALNTPVYNLLGGACRDKMQVYCHVGGKTPDELLANAEIKLKQGYKVLRICPHDAGGDVCFEPGEMARRSVRFMKRLREGVGEDVEIIFEGHTRFTPTRAIEICNAIAEYRPLFAEDMLRADSPEMYRLLRDHTDVPLGTGEKFGAKWDYKYVIENDLIDYLRTDLCSCGGITEAKKIAALGESHYMEMIPHGTAGAVGMLATLHLDLATPNFLMQEYNYNPEKPAAFDYGIEFKDGYITLPDRPGLGVVMDETKTTAFRGFEHPHWRRVDGTVQDW